LLFFRPVDKSAGAAARREEKRPQLGVSNEDEAFALERRDFYLRSTAKNGENRRAKTPRSTR
jgi:hypothetical protein